MRVSPRVAGLCGLLAPPLGWAFIAASIAANPWFRWRDHALSHLGSPAGSVPALFNAGLVLTGGLGLVMVAGLGGLATDLRGRAGRALLAVALASLIGVGIFPWPHLPGLTPGEVPEFTPQAVAHTATAATFFLLIPISLILAGRSEALRGEPLGRAVLSLGIGSLAVVLAFPVFVVGAASFEGVAIPEALAAGFMSAASILFGRRLLRGDFPGASASSPA
ncbi:MAG: DUF998 domain-containing protein [Halobacteria archaeon]